MRRTIDPLSPKKTAAKQVAAAAATAVVVIVVVVVVAVILKLNVSEIDLLQPLMQLQVCRSHSGEVLTELCHDCETIFCGFCSEHAEHHTERLTDTAVGRQRDDLFELLQTITEPVAKALQSLNAVQAVIKQLGENHASSRRDVNEMFDNLVAVVERQRQLALSELDHAFDTKDFVLQQQASIW